MKHWIVFTWVLASSWLPPTLSAATVYSQGANPNTFSRSDVDFGKRMADDFTLTTAATIRSVSWQGAYWSDGIASSPDDFTILFYADSSGSPTGAPIASFHVGNAVNRASAGFSFPSGFTFPVFDYSANIGAGLPVAANTPLWLSIVNNAAGTRQWGWATRFPDTVNVLNDTRRSSDGGVTWPENFANDNLTFSLLDTVAIPEPYTHGLLALGGVWGMLRRRRTGGGTGAAGRP